ncbi:MAG: helix-turn-helix domain-containing protein [Lysobacterales bacterium]
MSTWLAGLAGFTSGVALLLALGLLTLWRRVALPLDAQIGGLVMLGGLSWTSWRHLALAQLTSDQSLPWDYPAVLLAQSLGFYLLLLGVLDLRSARWRLWLPPLLLSAMVYALAPVQAQVPLAMLLGSAYAMHLGWRLWQLRRWRRWFRLELPIIALFAGMGLLVASAGVLTPGWIGWSSFTLLYSAQIAIGFALMGILIVAAPDVVEKTREAVAASQPSSALSRVDVEAAAARVRRALDEDGVYRDERLTLAKLASLVDLSTHQLSALLNGHFGLSFAQLLRRHRVQAARRMLVEEPGASVLSVGMAVGFASQSTFYVAFKDEVGLVPGEFRRQALGASAD